jgi:hypothetical protein
VVVHDPAQTRYEVEAEGLLAELGGYAIGTEWDRLRPGLQSRRCLNLRKPALYQPCPTVT